MSKRLRSVIETAAMLLVWIVCVGFVTWVMLVGFTEPAYGHEPPGWRVESAQIVLPDETFASADLEVMNSIDMTADLSGIRFANERSCADAVFEAMRLSYTLEVMEGYYLSGWMARAVAEAVEYRVVCVEAD